MRLTVLCTYSKMLYQEHFDAPSDIELKLRDKVVLDTRRGELVGEVSALPGQVKPKRDQGVEGRVLRKATPEDLAHTSKERINVRVSDELRTARQMAKEARIDMRFLDVEETLDQTRSIFYFTAADRIDFRDLAREMGARFQRRIELRHINDREAARLTGDVGSCGTELCCKTFLVDFVPVSMKMAKNQGGSLDNNKVSGMCGRLKCCLKYEDDLYTELRKTVPRYQQPVHVKVDGKLVEGWACNVDVLNQIVKVQTDESREEFPASEVVFEPMSERAVRNWQKEYRERRRREYEERQAKRGQRRMGGAHGGDADAKKPAITEAAKEAIDAAVADVGGDANEQQDTRDGAPRSDGAKEQAPRKKSSRKRGGRKRKPAGSGEGSLSGSSKPSGESKPRASGGEARPGSDGPDGAVKKKTGRKRRRGGRGRNRGGGGDGSGPAGQSGGGAPASPPSA